MRPPKCLDQKAQELGFNTYNDYLKNSMYRHSFRLRQIRDACSSCTDWGKWKMVLHHVSYARMGREYPEDVVTLCQWCHDQAHQLVWDGECELADAHLILRKRNADTDHQLILNFDDRCNQPDAA